MKSKTKKIGTILVGALLITAVAVYGILNYYIKPKYAKQITGAIEEILLEDEDLLKEIAKNYENPGEKDKENQKTDDIDSGAENQAGKNEKANQATSGEEEASKGVDSQKDTGSKEGKIPAADLKEMKNLASKIDTGYLLGLAKGGVTAEEKSAAKAHLKSNLTAEEYSRLLYLTSKYMHLLK